MFILVVVILFQCCPGLCHLNETLFLLAISCVFYVSFCHCCCMSLFVWEWVLWGIFDFVTMFHVTMFFPSTESELESSSFIVSVFHSAFGESCDGIDVPSFGLIFSAFRDASCFLQCDIFFFFFVCK